MPSAFAPNPLRYLLSCVPILLNACTDAATSADLAPVVRDSAGIEIVEHSAGLIAALPEWGVVGDPIVELGSGEQPAEEFTSIRGAVRLGDGRILLSEGGSNELRLFDGQGTYLTTWARKGQGPGEFTSISLPVLGPGDSILVADGSLRRTAVFDPGGRFKRQVEHPRSLDERTFLGVMAHLPDGGMLLQSSRFGSDPTSLGGPITRDTFAIVRAGADAARLDTVALVPGPELYPVPFKEGEYEGIGRNSPAFGRSSYTAVSADGQLLLGTNEANEVRVYQGGVLRRILRDGTPAQPVLEAHKVRYRQDQEANFARSPVSEAVKAQWRENAARSERFAETMPYYERLLFGTDGSIWVEAKRRFDDEGRRYVVYGADGRAVARAVFPDRVRPLQVGPDEMIGMWRDPDDVVHLRIWRVGPVGR